jgi:hypothetical protein
VTITLMSKEQFDEHFGEGKAEFFIPFHPLGLTESHPRCWGLPMPGKRRARFGRRASGGGSTARR